MHLWLLIKDAWLTNDWKDKFRIWFMPTGWRPEDVAEKYPVYKINDVYHFEKYDTPASKPQLFWYWIQILLTLFFISYLFGNIAYINSLNPFYIYIYGIFIFLSVYAYTDLMDLNKHAWIFETIKNLFGAAILLYIGDWFGSSKWSLGINYVLFGYFVAATLITYYLSRKELVTN